MQLGMNISILKVMGKMTLSGRHWSGQRGAAASELEFGCQFNGRFSFRKR